MGQRFLSLLLSFFLVTACWDDQGKRFSLSEVEAGAFSVTEEDALSGLYATYVDAQGGVNYEGWLQNKTDLDALRGLVSAIAREDVAVLSPAEKMSFYINAYNVLTIDLILRKFPETLGDRLSPYPGKRSIRNIDRLDAKVWDEFTWTVGGRTLSLNDIEHRILRPMGDARIHFALVCASKGCPPLIARAVSARDLDGTLEMLSRKFVNEGRDVRVDETGRLTVSSILSWFSADFVKSFGSVRKFLETYADGPLRPVVETAPIEFLSYDWTLNDQSGDSSEDNPDDVGSGSEEEPEVGSDTEFRRTRGMR